MRDMPLDPIEARLAERVIQFRVAAGLTQQMLATHIGVSYQQVHKYESGMNRMSLARLSRIAGAVGKSLPDLLDGLDDEAPSPTRLHPNHRLIIDLAQAARSIADRRQMVALLAMARAMAGEVSEAAE